MTKEIRPPATREPQAVEAPTSSDDAILDQDETLDQELRKLGAAEKALASVPESLLTNLLEQIPSSKPLGHMAQTETLGSPRETDRPSSWNLVLVAACFVALIAAGYSALFFLGNSSTLNVASSTRQDRADDTGSIPAISDRPATEQEEPVFKADLTPQDIGDSALSGDDLGSAKETVVDSTAPPELSSKKEVLSKSESRDTFHEAVPPSKEKDKATSLGLRQEKPKRDNSTVAARGRSPRQERLSSASSNRDNETDKVELGRTATSVAWEALRTSLQQGLWPDSQLVEAARRSLPSNAGLPNLSPAHLQRQSISDPEVLSHQILDLLQSDPSTEVKSALASTVRSPGDSEVIETVAKPSLLPKRSSADRWRQLLHALDSSSGVAKASAPTFSQVARSQREKSTSPAEERTASSPSSSKPPPFTPPSEVSSSSSNPASEPPSVDLLRTLIEAALELLDR